MTDPHVAPTKPSVGVGLSQRVDWRPYTMLLILVIVAIGFQILTDGLFLTPRNLSNLVRQASLTAILAVGMVGIIVSGHIDLSAGSAVGLVCVVVAWLQVEAGQGPAVAILGALLTGAVMGAWQGAWIAFGNIPSFVVTLGGMLVFRGIALVITEGATLSPLDPGFVVLGQGFLTPQTVLVILAALYAAFMLLGLRARRSRVRYGLTVASRTSSIAIALIVLAVLLAIAAVSSLYLGVPYPVFIMVVIAGGMVVVMRRSTFGRRLYAIGGNLEASRLSGIDTRWHTFAIFALMGVLYAIVGILLAARLDAGPPNAGTFMELDAIAAAVIGGTSLLGGIGTIEGAVVGALLMASISNGMSLLNVLTWWQQIVTGLLLMAAVFVDINSKGRTR